MKPLTREEIATGLTKFMAELDEMEAQIAKIAAYHEAHKKDIAAIEGRDSAA